MFQKISESIFTPKEWFLSEKGPKEGERVARGHFHERVGESPVHWQDVRAIRKFPEVQLNSALQQLTALHCLNVSALSLKETTLWG